MDDPAALVVLKKSSERCDTIAWKEGKAVQKGEGVMGEVLSGESLTLSTAVYNTGRPPGTVVTRKAR